jgi:Uma2 family endonuclease
MTNPVTIQRKVWTREDVERLIELEFPSAERLELIDGDLIDHMGKKHPDNYWQTLIRLWLEKTFGGEYVQVEPSIYVAENDNLKNEPNPDLVLTEQSIREYTDNVTPRDIRLLIEVADSSLNLDLGKKLVLYAQAGIAEYWVVDIPNQLVHVHRTPELGHYTHCVKYSFTEEITPLAGQDAIFRVSGL